MGKWALSLIHCLPDFVTYSLSFFFSYFTLKAANYLLAISLIILTRSLHEIKGRQKNSRFNDFSYLIFFPVEFKALLIFKLFLCPFYCYEAIFNCINNK